MSDPLSTSRTARESLARGLNALQADPSVPSHLVDLAAPIAQAMGALHQLERTGQLSPHADVALNHVRGALAQLQAATTSHPAVSAALESVAKSLTLVHSLSQMANGQAKASPTAAGQPAAAPASPQRPAPPPTASPAGAPPAAARPAPNAAASPAAPVVQSVTAALPPIAAQRSAFSQPVNPMAPTSPAIGNAPSPMVSRDPFAAPAGDPFASPAPAPAAAAAAPATPAPRPATPSMPVPAPPMVGNMPVIQADLGAHSVTNFYKGLSGNDIIDHGGLFVQTYVPPKIGTPIRLKVSLPGGYEFEANAVVKWTREQGADAPPGFGAQFTAITPEARQLVYRYVRNREPLFHDDL